jgi:hypothetical protein
MEPMVVPRNKPAQSFPVQPFVVPPQVRIGHVHLKVADLERALRMALVTDDKQSDYDIVLVWDEGSWSAYTQRTDSAELPHETNADYEAVLRRVCDAIARDARLWTADRVFRSQSDVHLNREENDQSPDGNRYDLREVRNGALTTTGLINKKSGRVWLWTDYHDKLGNKSSGFLEEEETPKPDNQ